MVLYKTTLSHKMFAKCLQMIIFVNKIKNNTFNEIKYSKGVHRVLL